MDKKEISFNNKKDRFRFEELSTINHGIEGQKRIVRLESLRGIHGNYILKDIYEEDGPKQIKKYKFLKERGVTLPKIFKLAKTSEGRTVLCIEDLTEKGKYIVLSKNNPETVEDEYKNLARQISAKRRTILMEDLISMSLKAADIGTQTDNVQEEKILQMDNAAYMLVIDPVNPDNSRIVVADLGTDVYIRNRKDQDEVIKRNLLMATDFYAWMFGEKLQLTESSPYASENEELSKHAEEIIRIRNF